MSLTFYTDYCTKILCWSLKLGKERQRKKVRGRKGEREGGKAGEGKRDRGKEGGIVIILAKIFPGSVRVK